MAGEEIAAAVFRQMVESLPQLAFLATPAGECTYASPQWSEYTGLPASHLLGLGWVEALFGAEREGVVAAWEEGVREGGFVRDTCMRRHDGEYHWIRVQAVPLLADPGQPPLWCGTAVDIDAEKRSQDALRDSEHRLRSLFEHMLNGFAHCRLIYADGVAVDYEVLDANAAVERVSGLRVNKGDRISQEVPGYLEANPTLLETFARVAAGGGPTRLEHHVAGLDAWFDISVYSPAPQEFVLVFDNITDRVRAAEALHRSEERFRHFFELSPDLLTICDLETNRFIEVNAAWEATLGYTCEELKAKTWMDFIHPDDLQKTDYVARGVARGTPVLSFENRYVRKDGGVVWLEWRSMPVDEERRTFAVARDVTARKASEEALRQSEELARRAAEMEEAAQHAREASRLKGEFLANMSHELRTPLNAIIGFAELMHTGNVGPMSDPHREYLGDILASSKHLLALINDILDLAKVESGKLEFRPEPLVLKAVIAEVTDITRELAAKRRVRVTTEVDERLDDIEMDPRRLKQILYNLLSNAIKFTRGEGSVVLRALPAGPDWWRLEVQDTGIGIRSEDLAKLFVEFQQLDTGSGKQHAGTGLGLALTKRIVDALGGRIGVHSKHGEGSLFFAVLPRRAEIQEPARMSAPLLVPAVDGAPTVLVVEDDPRDQDWLARTLMGAGYGVQVAGSVSQALMCLAESPFDAVTLDVMLPDGAGWKVLECIRRDEQNASKPVVVVSIAEQPHGEASNGVDGMLVKPCTEDDLLLTLQRAGLRLPGSPAGYAAISKQAGIEASAAALPNAPEVA